jgi:hypothetical protein
VGFSRGSLDCKCFGPAFCFSTRFRERTCLAFGLCALLRIGFLSELRSFALARCFQRTAIGFGMRFCGVFELALGLRALTRLTREGCIGSGPRFGRCGRSLLSECCEDRCSFGLLLCAHALRRLFARLRFSGGTRMRARESLLLRLLPGYCELGCALVGCSSILRFGAEHELGCVARLRSFECARFCVTAFSGRLIGGAFGFGTRGRFGARPLFSIRALARERFGVSLRLEPCVRELDSLLLGFSTLPGELRSFGFQRCAVLRFGDCLLIGCGTPLRSGIGSALRFDSALNLLLQLGLGACTRTRSFSSLLLFELACT